MSGIFDDRSQRHRYPLASKRIGFLIRDQWVETFPTFVVVKRWLKIAMDFFDVYTIEAPYFSDTFSVCKPEGSLSEAYNI